MCCRCDFLNNLAVAATLCVNCAHQKCGACNTFQQHSHNPFEQNALEALETSTAEGPASQAAVNLQSASSTRLEPYAHKDRPPAESIYESAKMSIDRVQDEGGPPQAAHWRHL